jgi:hypothetical protein
VELPLGGVNVLLLRLVLLLLQLDVARGHVFLIAMRVLEPLIIVVPDALLDRPRRHVIALLHLVVVQVVVVPGVVVALAGGVVRLLILLRCARVGLGLVVLPGRQGGRCAVPPSRSLLLLWLHELVPTRVTPMPAREKSVPFVGVAHKFDARATRAPEPRQYEAPGPGEGARGREAAHSWTTRSNRAPNLARVVQR